MVSNIIILEIQKKNRFQLIQVIEVSMTVNLHLIFSNLLVKRHA